jgi:hypothetical protein
MPRRSSWLKPACCLSVLRDRARAPPPSPALRGAASRGWNAALVADDRTNLTLMEGAASPPVPSRSAGCSSCVAAECPCAAHLAARSCICIVPLTEPSAGTRLPPEEDETFSCGDGISFLFMRLWHDGAARPLARLRSWRPGLFFRARAISPGQFACFLTFFGLNFACFCPR